MGQKRKYTKRKHLLTREMLDRNNIRVEFNEDGQPIVYKGERELKQSLNTTHHKYGKDRTYVAMQLYLDSNYWSVMLSNIVWVYFNSSIPEGYDVDHINDDPLDNRLENLQLLTRKENLRKRGCGINQFTCNWTEEEREASAEKRHQNEKATIERKKHNQKVNDAQKRLRELFEQTKMEREYYQMLLEQAQDKSVKKWLRQRSHALAQKKICIGHYMRKNNDHWEF